MYSSKHSSLVQLRLTKCKPRVKLFSLGTSRPQALRKSVCRQRQMVLHTTTALLSTLNSPPANPQQNPSLLNLNPLNHNPNPRAPAAKATGGLLHTVYWLQCSLGVTGVTHTSKQASSSASWVAEPQKALKCFGKLLKGPGPWLQQDTTHAHALHSSRAATHKAKPTQGPRTAPHSKAQNNGSRQPQCVCQQPKTLPDQNKPPESSMQEQPPSQLKTLATVTKVGVLQDMLPAVLYTAWMSVCKTAITTNFLYPANPTTTPFTTQHMYWFEQPTRCCCA